MDMINYWLPKIELLGSFLLMNINLLHFLPYSRLIVISWAEYQVKNLLLISIFFKNLLIGPI